MQITCPKCDGTGAAWAYGFRVYEDLLAQTPKSVWDEYRANGYTQAQAIKEELSYGDIGAAPHPT